jgi:hypothetical protein
LEFIAIFHGGFMIFKRIFAVFLCSVLLFCATGCGGAQETSVEGGTVGTTAVTTQAVTTTTASTTTVATTTVAPKPAINLPLIVKSTTLTRTYYLNTDGDVCLRNNNSVVMSGVKSIYENTGSYDKVYYFIKNDNTLWGYGSGKLLGDDTGVDKKNIEDSVKILDNVAEIREYSNIFYAITKDKELYGWGSDVYEDTIYAPKLILNDVVSFTDDAAVKSDGSLWYIKDQNNHLLYGNFSKIRNVIAEKVFPIDTEYNRTSCVLLANGDLMETEFSYSEGILFSKLCSDVVSCDKYTNVFIVYKKDGSMWAMGENAQGELGDGSKIPRDSFVQIADNVKKAYPYAYITNDNKLMIWDSDNPKPKLYSEDVVEFYNYFNGNTISYGGDLMLKTDGSVTLLNNYYGKTDVLYKNVMVPTEEIIGSTGAIATSAGSASSGKTTLNIYAFTNEVPSLFNKYFEVYPEREKLYDLNVTVLSTATGEYQPALDRALKGGSATVPDLFCVESAFLYKYTKGDMSSYAAPYEDLGIDVDNLIKTADIAQYTIDFGSNPSGDVVALGYQATGGAFIYRSSIAKDTWGTDDPDEIAKKIGPGWDKFMSAASDLKAKGYSIVSGEDDIWHPVEKSASSSWVVNGKLNIPRERLAFFDIAKKLKDNNYHNGSLGWSDDWYNDMKGIGKKPVFGFFGPAWFLGYTLAPDSGKTFGDWRVCVPPAGYYWGGTYLSSSKDSPNKEAIGDFIEWVTLDSSKTGLQHYWANGTLYDGETTPKDVVASATVMANSDGSVDFLGGQNMFDVYIRANELAKGKNNSIYDDSINRYFRSAVDLYTSEKADLETALAWFKKQVADNLDIVV